MRIGTLFQKAFEKPLSLEQKLQILAECGLKLEPPFTIDDLLRSWNREQFDKSGFDLVLVGLAMSEEQHPWRSHCANAWHFDTECIEGHGDYCRIAARMAEMTQGSLILDNIRDHVDLENSVAWLQLDFRGQNVHVDCQVQDDWVDPELFGYFVQLLGNSNPSKIYIRYDLAGQDCVIACVTKTQFGQLTKAGIPFQPLQ